jgi:hypothetical protein
VQTIIEKNTDYNKITQTELLEDYFIGRFLNENGIFPTSINIQNQACFW